MLHRQVTHDSTTIPQQSQNMVNNERAALLTPTDNASCLTQGLRDGVKPQRLYRSTLPPTGPSVCLPSNIIHCQLLIPHSDANQNTTIQY